MKLIMEGASLLTGHFEDEMNEGTGSTERNYYISGIFSTPEAKNRNGRVYSRAIWEREVKKYQKEINEKTVNTLGEWQHPPRSTVDPLKAVLRIVELKLDETGNVVGKAKILNNNTEATNSIKGLIKEGIKIGVSSRGVGKVSATGVVEDFKLITYDAVDMPSDYNAMLNGMVEGYQFENGIMQDKEYQIDENGCIGEACSLTPKEDITESGEEMENKEKCPIQEKINEAVKIAKEEIYSNIDDYLQEAFKQVEDKQTALVEGLSDFLEGKPLEDKEVEIVDEAIVSDDKTKAELMLEAFKKLSEKEDEKEEKSEEDGKKKCSECGKEMDEKSEEDKCDACSDKDEEDEEKKVEETIKALLADGSVTEKELEDAAKFAKICSSFEDFNEAFPNMDEKALLTFKRLF